MSVWKRRVPAQRIGRAQVTCVAPILLDCLKCVEQSIAALRFQISTELPSSILSRSTICMRANTGLRSEHCHPCETLIAIGCRPEGPSTNPCVRLVLILSHENPDQSNSVQPYIHDWSWRGRGGLSSSPARPGIR